jgi:hypothetical protein
METTYTIDFMRLAEPSRRSSYYQAFHVTLLAAQL